MGFIQLQQPLPCVLFAALLLIRIISRLMVEFTRKVIERPVECDNPQWSASMGAMVCDTSEREIASMHPVSTAFWYTLAAVTLGRMIDDGKLKRRDAILLGLVGMCFQSATKLLYGGVWGINEVFMIFGSGVLDPVTYVVLFDFDTYNYQGQAILTAGTIVDAGLTYAVETTQFLSHGWTAGLMATLFVGCLLCPAIKTLTRKVEITDTTVRPTEELTAKHMPFVALIVISSTFGMTAHVVWQKHSATFLDVEVDPGLIVAAANIGGILFTNIYRILEICNPTEPRSRLIIAGFFNAFLTFLTVVALYNDTVLVAKTAICYVHAVGVCSLFWLGIRAVMDTFKTYKYRQTVINTSIAIFVTASEASHMLYGPMEAVFGDKHAFKLLVLGGQNLAMIAFLLAVIFVPRTPNENKDE